MRNVIILAVLFSSVCSTVLAAPAEKEEHKTAKEKSLRIYETGKWRDAPIAELERAEQDRWKRGLQPWRESILDSAELSSLDLCGIKDLNDLDSWHSEYSARAIVLTKKDSTISYTLRRQKNNAATVILVTPDHKYRLKLQRPCERDWYITSFEEVGR